MKEEYFSQAVFDYNMNKMCDLRDNSVEAPGQAEDIQMPFETSGWKEMSFKLPTMVDGKRNFRQDYMHPEYLIRMVDGNEVDWYIINEPSDVRNNRGYTVTITAVHNSVQLKTKNLYMVFDDTNGIGTIRQQVNRILTGTDWSLGLCDTLYESDGVTEKIRSLQSDGKAGAYQLLLDVCQLFMCYPTFHGDTKTIDIHSLAAKDGMMEFNFGSNIKSITRKRNSSNLVTRLYVEGQYTDDGAYVGIEDVNPTGLGFILNFDYYKSLGVFTDTHQQAVDNYVSLTQNVTTQIHALSTELQSKMTELNTLWGPIDYVVYRINGSVQDSVIGGSATEEDKAFSRGDALTCVIDTNGVITTQEIECPANTEPAWPSGTVYAIKYILPAAGRIGGKEVAIEAKQNTIADLNEKINDPDVSEIQKDKYRELVSATQQEISALQMGETGAFTLTYDACVLAFAIDGLNEQIEALQDQQRNQEADLVIALGDMLRDGYWSNNNYIPGQEQALYDDALAISQEMAKPEYTYNITILDLSELKGHECDTLKTNQQIRFYDDEIPLNDYAYITKIVRHPTQKYKNTMEVSTSAVSATRSSFQSSFNRINQIAQIVEEKKQIYARASALTERGQLSAAALNGIIDVNRVQILSTMSNWYTDEDGNMLFEALDGGSAMLLSGSGFAIANTKREDGSWNWRTFGNGNGFTADEINAGTLNAGQITILGTADFFWDADSIRIYTNGDETEQIRIGRYDGVNYGIAFTKDGGSTWNTALTADGLVVGYGSLDNDLKNVFTRQDGATVINGGSIQTGSITADKVSANFGESLDLSSNAGINLTVSNLEGQITTAQNTANSASAAASNAATAASNAATAASNAATAASNAQSTADSAVEAAGNAATAASNAQAAANEAQTSANNANTAAGNAQSAADSAQTIANEAQSAANAAATAAGNAQSAADTAQNTANSANVAASGAQTTADNAQTAAGNAQTTADNATTAAGNAATAASNAQSTANGAQTAADAAQSTANNAQTSASNAQAAADNAQTSANNAQTSADNAQSAADTAQSTANTAQSTANAAQSTANEAKAGVTSLEITVGEISTSVSDIDGRLTTTSQTVGEISTSVSDIDDRLTTTTQTADKINWIVASGTSATDMTMTDRAYTVIASNINLNGNTTFTNLVNGLANGTTTISGGCITTGTIDASKVTVSNLSASNITSGSMSANRITSGTMSANRISGGTIDATDVSIVNLNANNITSGTISADRVDTSGLTVSSLDYGNYAVELSGGNLSFNYGSSNYASMGFEASAFDITAGTLLRLFSNSITLNTGRGNFMGLSYGSFSGQNGNTVTGPITSVGAHLLPNSTSEYYLGGQNYHWFRAFCDESTFRTGSDRALKDDIEPLDSINILRGLKPVSYILKKDLDKQVRFGFIAQDVRDVLMDTKYDNSAFFDDGGGEGNLGLLYGELFAPLVEGWQAHEKIISEQQKKIDELEQRLAAIEAKINV